MVSHRSQCGWREPLAVRCIASMPRGQKPPEQQAWRTSTAVRGQQPTSRAYGRMQGGGAACMKLRPTSCVPDSSRLPMQSVPEARAWDTWALQRDGLS